MRRLPAITVLFTLGATCMLAQQKKGTRRSVMGGQLYFTTGRAGRWSQVFPALQASKQ
jgi:hypothetical protein